MNNLTYTNRNGYQIPNLMAASQEEDPETLTRFGRAREKYLMEHRKALYTSLLLKGTLWSHLTEIDQAANQQMDSLITELAASEGVTLTDGDIERWLKLLDGLDPKGRTSMCQDVEAGRKTELELFAGTILGICKEAGIQAPVNEFLYERLTELNHAAEQA